MIDVANAELDRIMKAGGKGMPKALACQRRSHVKGARMSKALACQRRSHAKGARMSKALAGPQDGGVEHGL